MSIPIQSLKLSPGSEKTPTLDISSSTGSPVIQFLLRLLLLGGTATIIAGASYALISPISEPDLPSENANRSVRSLDLPIPSAYHEPIRESQRPFNNWRSHRIQPGENISLILPKLGISEKTAQEIVNSAQLADKLNRIQPDKIISAEVSAGGTLNRLIYSQNATESIEIQKAKDGFDVKKILKQVERRVIHAHGTINSSLYWDAHKAGLSDKLIMQLADTFAWDIDFALDLREGDQFTLLYEGLFSNGDRIGSGEILAAEFVNRGRSHKAVLFADAKGHSDHYSPEGKSLRKAFLRTPVEFSRISSKFNLQRRHPVLNTIRAHKGVDYAAPIGTPVQTTGEGVVDFQGSNGGYGRVVIVRHGQEYTTLYAHLSRYHPKIKKGSRVGQGQIIGYVGQSGLATGPHLHYEFRINGTHRNPLTVALPKAKPLPNEYLADFKAKTLPLLGNLEKIKTHFVAQAN